MKPVSDQSPTHQNMRLRLRLRRVKMDFFGESDPGIKPGFFILKDRILKHKGHVLYTKKINCWAKALINFDNPRKELAQAGAREL